MLLWVQRAVGFGLIGLLIECLFTGFKSLLRKDIHGTGTTYLSMIPIYGTAAMLLELIKDYINQPAVVLAPIYMLVIYGSEFSWGFLYKKVTGSCPWDYGRGKWTILGLINLKYWPFWFLLSLVFNKVSFVLHGFVRFLNI